MAAAPNKSDQLQNEALNGPKQSLGLFVLRCTRNYFPISGSQTALGHLKIVATPNQDFFFDLRNIVLR